MRQLFCRHRYSFAGLMHLDGKTYVRMHCHKCQKVKAAQALVSVGQNGNAEVTPSAVSPRYIRIAL